MTSEEETPELHSCGYEEDTFACKIRHLQINSGSAKANPQSGSRWDRAQGLHHDKFNEGI